MSKVPTYPLAPAINMFILLNSSFVRNETLLIFVFSFVCTGQPRFLYCDANVTKNFSLFNQAKFFEHLFKIFGVRGFNLDDCSAT